MSYQSAPPNGVSSRELPSLSSAAGLFSMPAAFLAAPRFVLNGVRQTTRIDLSNPAHFHRFDYTVDYNCNGFDEADQVTKQTEALVKNDEWIELAVLIKTWDRTRRKTELGKPFTEISLRAIRKTLASEIFARDVSNFDFYARIDDAAMARVAQAHEAVPENYVLTAILAQLYIDRGWFERGGGLTEEVSPQGWNGMSAAFDKADELVGTLYPKGFDSALLAQVQFGLVTGIEDGREIIKSRYQAWSDLDPGNQLPHRAYAFHLLPHWYGSFELLEKEARAAAERTAQATGAAAYCSFYLEALRIEDEALMRLDSAFFAKGVADLIDHHDNLLFTNAFAYMLSEAFASREFQIWNYGHGKQINEKLSETHALFEGTLTSRLTAIVPKAWGGSLSNALRYISTLFQSELKRGARLILDDTGIHTGAGLS